MIDLNDAGRRLAATRVAPTPPIAAVHARRARRTRHRRIAATGIITSVLVVVAFVLALVSTGNHHAERVIAVSPPTSTPATVTLPSYPGVRGSTPYDFERIRIWLPKGWTTSTDLSCQNAGQTLYLPGNYQPTPTCAKTATDRLVVEPLSAIPRTTAKMIVNGITVFFLGSPVSVSSSEYATFTWYIPSLDVQLTVAGTPADAVAATLGPSPLQHLLTDPLPIAVPSAWKTVTYDGFQAKVPDSWPTYSIVTTHLSNGGTSIGPLPGVCGPPLFSVPSVWFGAIPGIHCEAMIQKTAEPTDDGLWLQPSEGATLSIGNPQRRVIRGTTQIVITPGSGDAISVEIDVAGHRINADIGLGINPATAEAILSSISPVPAE